jgi:hypothetical protein
MNTQEVPLHLWFEINVGTCDKCGRRVPFENSSFAVAHEAGLILRSDRHFLPITENGVTVCEGSPSNAQYIEGQPRDIRPEYPYLEEREAEVREAYKRHLASCRELGFID